MRGTGGVTGTGGATGTAATRSVRPRQPRDGAAADDPGGHVRRDQLRRARRRQDRQHAGHPGGAERRPERGRRHRDDPAGTFLCGTNRHRQRHQPAARLGRGAEDAAAGSYPSPRRPSSPRRAARTTSRISGAGTIDGQGQAWWDAFASDSALTRPQEVNLGHVTRIQMSGIKLTELARGAHLGQERHQRHHHRHHHHDAGRVRQDRRPRTPTASTSPRRACSSATTTSWPATTTSRCRARTSTSGFRASASAMAARSAASPRTACPT